MTRRHLLVAACGAAAGLMSGLFGVGGGLVIVPALRSAVGMSARRAAATSLAAIVLTSAVGCLSYAWRGQVSLAATALLVAGSLVGTRAGTWALHRLPERVLPWTFVAFAAAIVVSHQLQVPARHAPLALGPASGAALVGVGLLAGFLAGLVGVGGGAVIVPGLETVVGVGDLLARGTSLAAMIPTAAAGSAMNLRHRAVDLRVAALVGVTAAATAPLGTLAASAVSPATGALLFNCFLAWVILSTVGRQVRRRRAEAGAGGPRRSQG